jgi:hypothetical protein
MEPHFSMPNKKQKHSDESIEMAQHCELPPLQFHDVWKPLVSSQFLTNQELGRLLLLTNKGLLEDANDDTENVWKLLCQNHWGYEAADTLLRATGMSPKACFRKLVCKPKDPDTYTLPPLRYSPQDYLLIVDAFNQVTNKLLFCETIPGENVPDFFAHGRTYYPLDHPIVNHVAIETTFQSFEEYLASLDGHYNDGEYVHAGTPAWKGAVHLMRKQDQKIIQLLKISNNGESCGVEPFRHGILRDNPNEIGSDYESVSAGWTRHRDLMKHLGPRNDRYDYVDGDLRMDFELAYKAKLAPTGTTLDITGFFLSTWLWDNAIENILETKEGVMFAHVLESLSDWDTDVQS